MSLEEYYCFDCRDTGWDYSTGLHCTCPEGRARLADDLRRVVGRTTRIGLTGGYR